MNETGVMGETGTRAGVVLLLSGEIVAIIQEATARKLRENQS